MSFTVQGQLLDNANAPVSGTANFQLKLLDKTGTCTIYSEQHLNYTVTNGLFSLELGSGTSKVNNIDNNSTYAKSLFENKGVSIPVAGCANQTFASGDERLVQVVFNLGGGPITMDPVKMLSSAYATISADSDRVGGVAADQLLRVNAAKNLDQANLESIFDTTNFGKMTALLGGSSTMYLQSTSTAVPKGAAAPTVAENGKSLRWNNAGGVWEWYDPASGGGGGSSAASATDYVINTNNDGAGADGGVKFQNNGTDLVTISNLGIVNFASTQASSSTTNGALVVAGGIGVAGAVNAGGGFNSKSATAATVGANSNSPSIYLSANYWNGAASAVDQWSITNVMGTGTNPTSTLTFAHPAGTSGAKQYAFSDGNVGIGTTAPSKKLDVVGSNDSVMLRIANTSSTTDNYPGLLIENYIGTGAGWASPKIQYHSHGGSIASPTALVQDNPLGIMEFWGSTDTAGATARGAMIVALAENNWSGTSAPSLLAFETTASGATSTTERMRISSTGSVGIGTNNPSAILHLKAGTATAGTAPLKFNSGTNLTTPEDGAMEFNGTNLFITSGGTRRTIATTTGTGTISSVDTIQNAGGSITMTPSAGNSVIVNQTTVSTGTTSGSLIVNGGAGIAGAVNVGGGINSMSATAATVGANVSSPSIYLSANYWTGAASAVDQWSITNVMGTGSNPTSTLTFAHPTGTSGTKQYAFTDGNVGVGTASPGAVFDVWQGSGTPDIFRAKVSAANGGNEVKIDAWGNLRVTNVYFGNAVQFAWDTNISDWAVSSQPGSPLRFTTDAGGAGNSNILFLPSGTGKVGIGTTAPGTLLDVSGAITSRPSGTGTGQTGQILLRELATNGTNTVSFRAPDAIGSDLVWTLPAADGTTGQFLSTNGSGVLSWATASGGGSVSSLDAADGSPTGVVAIDNTGLVGIGTSTPAAKLDVNGGAYFQATGANANDGVIVQSSPSTAYQGGLFWTNSASFDNGTAGHYAYKASAAGTGTSQAASILRIGLVQANAPNTYLTNDLVLNNGSVGIGTTAPGKTLEVRTTSATTIASYGADTSQNGMMVGASDTNRWTFFQEASGVNRNFNIYEDHSGVGGTTGIRFSIQPGGKVGIGTANPGYLLTTASSTAKATASTVTVAGFGSSDASGTADLSLLVRMGGSATAGLRWTGLQSYEAGTSTRHLVLQDQGGRVGINTTGPAAPLHIGKTSSIADFKVGDDTDSLVNASGFRIYTYSDGNNYLDGRTATGGYTHFRTGAGAGEYGYARTYMSVAGATGNVGIGTTVPGTLLDVSGAITSRPSGTGTGQTGQLVLRELAANGTNTVTLKAPDNVTSNRSFVLPDSVGTNGQSLITDGSGNLSWGSSNQNIQCSSATNQSDQMYTSCVRMSDGKYCYSQGGNWSCVAATGWSGSSSWTCSSLRYYGSIYLNCVNPANGNLCQVNALGGNWSCSTPSGWDL